MITSFHVENFKSIRKLGVKLGRVTVLIGANGSGKSNLIEAIGFMAPGLALGQQDRSLLEARGVRFDSDAASIRSLFPGLSKNDAIELKAKTETGVSIDQRLTGWSEAFNTWMGTQKIAGDNKLSSNGMAHVPGDATDVREIGPQSVWNRWLEQNPSAKGLATFHIYTPEPRALRTFSEEGQALPLGIHGEGLFQSLRSLIDHNPDAVDDLRSLLTLVDWFGGFEIPKSSLPTERTVKFRDRFMKKGLNQFSQRLANEGILFLLFYGVLLTSPSTPGFFAIDNVDVALNPRMCSELMWRIAQLAQKYDKQVILTTHSPAILDGMNLADDSQRLYVTYRNIDGHTTLRRIPPLVTPEGKEPIAMSEAFMRGYIGGLPTNF